MKKIKTLSIAALAVMTAACSVEEAITPEIAPSAQMVEMTFGATIADEDEAEVKTALGTDGRSVVWTAGDLISVSTATDPFTVTVNETDPTKATVSGSAAVADAYYAAYPASAVTSWSGATATMTLASEQSATAGTFAQDLGFSVASTTADAMSFAFKNILGFIKVTIAEGSGSITKVAVTANGGESLSGTFTVDCSGAEPAVTVTNGSATASISSETALAPGNYYIAVIPGTYASGLTLTFTDASGATATKSVDSSITVLRNKINGVGTVSGLENISAGLWEKVIMPVSHNFESWSGTEYLKTSSGNFDWKTVSLSSGRTTLVFDLTLNSGTYGQVLVQNSSWKDFAEPVKIEISASSVVEIPLTQAMLNELQNGDGDGMVLNGDNVTLNSVTLKKLITVDTELWTGTHDVGNWNTNSDLTDYDWSTVSLPAYLRFDITLAEKSETVTYWDFALQNDEWSGYDSFASIGLSDGQAEVWVPITEELKAEMIAEGGPRITGHYYTLNKVVLMQY